MIKVLIVDDSMLIRRLLTEILSRDGNIDVVGTAVDPIDARLKIKELNPDVITLDIEMPRMDGITFLEKLIRLRPMPVVMISTLTEKGAKITLEALQIGAVDFIPKPKLDVGKALPALSADIIRKVKQAARANVGALAHNISQQQAYAPLSSLANKKPHNKYAFIAIGASTGGTEAIKQVLSSLPCNMPPIVIVQHMPPGFTRSFADRLDKMLDFKVTEFNQKICDMQANHVYIANGAEHMRVQKSGGKYQLIQDDSPAVNRHKPSVDVLFNSVAECEGDKAIGVILTGMGADGAAGLKGMRTAGAMTIAQDQASSVVWGMPRVAVEQDAAVEIIPLAKIGKELTELCYA